MTKGRGATLTLKLRLGCFVHCHFLFQSVDEIDGGGGSAT